MSEIAAAHIDAFKIPVKQTVDEWLNMVDYTEDPSYVPSEFALEFVNFIKLVNGSEGEEHKNSSTTHENA